MMTEDRNPESERDRLLLEAFKSGEYVTTGRGIKTREEAERRRKQGDEIRNLVLLGLAALATYGGATGAMGATGAATRRPPPMRGSEAAAKRSIEAQEALATRLQWQPYEGYGQLRGGVGSLLGRHRSAGMGDPALYRSSGGMSVPEDVLRAIEAVHRQAYKGIITEEELKVALWEIERRATPLGLSTRIKPTPWRGNPPGDPRASLN